MNRYAVAAVLSGAFFGLTGLFTRTLTGAGLSTMGILSIRCSVAALCFFCTALGDIRQLKMHKKDFWLFAAVGILGQGMFSFCYYNAINMMSISTACILMYLSPVFVTITMPRAENMLDGMNAMAVLTVGTTENVLWLPAEALAEQGFKTVVYTGFDAKTGELTGPVEVVTGVSDGDKVEIVGLEDDIKESVVTGTEMFHKTLEYAEAGDNVGCLLRGITKKEVERGQVLAAPKSIKPLRKFKGQVYVLSKEEGGRHTPFFNNYRPQFYFRTTDVTGVITLPEGVEMCMPGDNVDMDVELITPIAIENGLRFAIREGGRTVGSGVVIGINE